MQTTVRAYYERNTSLMVRLGAGRGEAAIHRAVWPPGVQSRREALHTVERRIAEVLGLRRRSGNGAARLLDLGCGVGGSAVWLASRHPVRVTGVTLSPTQTALAERRAAQAGLSGRCSFLTGDFHKLPEMENADGAYAIEAFSHSSRTTAFFGEAARVLRPGAALAICDDFVAAALPREGRDWVKRFRRGWHLGPLATAEQALAEAAAAGLRPEGREDLTRWLRLDSPGRIRLRLLISRLPLPDNLREWLSGAAALQMCLRRGWIRYLLLWLRRP